MAELAQRQHGVVATWQLKPIGYGRNAIAWRVRTGRLHRIHRGVYCVGYRRLSRKGRWMAAVLAYGPDAILSHGSAVVLWGLRGWASGPVDVTAPGRSRHSRKGIRVRNVRQLDDRDRTVVDGIPVTSLHRTLLDYAEVARHQQLRHAIEAAERLELLDGWALTELYERTRGRAGIKRLKQAVGEMQGPAPWTRSELERRFLALIRDAGLPEPSANVIVAGYEVDFWWPRERVVVELDGWEFHKTRERFESDRVKNAKLQLARCGVLHVTERRVKNEPQALLADATGMLQVERSGS